MGIDAIPLIERFVRLRYSGLSRCKIASFAILQILIAPFVSLFHSPHYPCVSQRAPFKSEEKNRAATIKETDYPESNLVE